MEQKDSYYDVLNVLPGSSWKKIDKAYQREKKVADRGRLKELNKAYKVLSDDKKRRAYDATLEPEAEPEKRQYTMEDLNRMTDEYRTKYYRNARYSAGSRFKPYPLWFITGGFMEEEDTEKIAGAVISIVIGLVFLYFLVNL